MASPVGCRHGGSSSVCGRTGQEAEGDPMARALTGNAYRWVIVAAGALMTCVGIGAMFSLAIFLEPMAVETGWSRAGISSAMTLNFLVMGLASFGWGALSDRIGARTVVLAGAALLGLALVLASRATTLPTFQI